MYIDKYISPLIANQFPAFYKDQGPNFIAFVKAYYEWAEQSGNFIEQSRSLFDNLDIDSTSAEFISHFKSQYVSLLPDSILGDKRLLMKHILDLYRSKGTPRAYNLLFRILFNEDIEFYIPNDYIFKASDNEWFVPRYIEVTGSPYLKNLIGKRISSVGETNSAVVDNFANVVRNGKEINILFLIAINGEFNTGSRIVCDDLYIGTSGAFIDNYAYSQLSDADKASYSLVYTDTNGPFITGSLSSVIIEDGGTGFSVGDTLSIQDGSGSEGKLKVLRIGNDTSGKVSFAIIDGGSGYTLNANVVVSGGGGAGATFKVGGLIDKELIYINTDLIPTYSNTSLESNTAGMTLGISGNAAAFSATGNLITSSSNVIVADVTSTTLNKIANGTYVSNTTLGINLYAYRSEGSLVWFTSTTDSDLNNANIVAGAIVGNAAQNAFVSLNTVWPKTAVTGNAVIVSSNSTAIIANTVNGYFITTGTVRDVFTTGTTNVNASITSVTRNTDWTFANSVSALDNLDSVIGQVLNFQEVEIGTIAFLSEQNPGSNYVENPTVTVTQPEVYAYFIPDGRGGFKGNNAIVKGYTSFANGVVTGAEVISSGYGYIDGESITAQSDTTNNSISIITVVDSTGKGMGRWRNSKSFISDINYLQDSKFYQQYSYQILAPRMLETYDTFVRDIVHQSGLALYGKYQLKDFQSSESTFEYASNTQTFVTDNPVLNLDFTTQTINSLAIFTRTSNGYYLDANGNMSVASANTPRYEYYSNGSFRGLLIESQRTNSIRNNSMTGANTTTNALPTNWSIFASSGLATRVVGTGVVNGIDYIDLRIVGTSTTTFYVLAFDGSVIATTAAQRWTESFWISLLSGSLTNITSCNINIRWSGGTDADGAFTPTSTFTRISHTGLSPTGTTGVYPALYLNFSSGVYVDLTLRIGMPQMELGTSMSSVIRTTTATATRAGDVLTVNSTSFSSIYNEISRAGAVYIDAVFPPVTSSNFGVFGISNNNAFANSSYFSYSNASTTYFWSIGVATAAGNTTTLLPGRNKIAAAWTSNTIKTGLNGVIVGDGTGTIGSRFNTYNRMYIGALWDGSSQFNGHFRQVKFYNKTKSNTEIIALTS
jgi:hypothetical protein